MRLNHLIFIKLCFLFYSVSIFMSCKKFLNAVSLTVFFISSMVLLCNVMILCVCVYVCVPYNGASQVVQR